MLATIRVSSFDWSWLISLFRHDRVIYFRNLRLANCPIPTIVVSRRKGVYFRSLSSGIPHGHTGHVRFLTCVETTTPTKPDPRPKVNRYSLKSGKTQQNNINRGKLLVISGGDGYEDFRGPQASAELQAGREDSTNHLLLWKVWPDLVRPSVSCQSIGFSSNDLLYRRKLF